MTVVLRALRSDDEGALRTLLDDPDTQRWNPLDADLSAWVARQNEESPEFATWAVADGADLVGVVSLFHLDRDQGTGEIGYRVVPAARGRGVATTSVRLAARHGFDVLGLRRVELFHAVANPASCAVAERAGFLLEGTLRESYVYGDGAAHDEHLHARLASDTGLT